MTRIRRLCALGALLLALPAAGARPARPNILLIAVDDLRALEDHAGRKPILTPNLDRLATQGVRFSRHFVQVPTCGASRYAMWTSRRDPAATGNESMRDRMPSLPDPESLAHLFRQHGYRTVGLGKLSHYPDGRIFSYDGTGDGRLEMPRSWVEMGLPYGAWGYGWGSFFAYAEGRSREGPQKISPAPIGQASDVPDTGYPDGLIAEAAQRKLRELKDSLFFLAVGFSKPHLPFSAPKQYWDLYNRSSLALTPYPDAPLNIHALPDGEMGAYSTGGLTGEALNRWRVHGYYAAASYVDAQIGKVLRTLDSLGLDRNTVVIVWGDHGWHLGEHGRWGKHTLFDWSLRSVLLARGPGIATGTAAGLVESLDIYPTLAELADLPLPQSVAGSSFRHLLRNPSLPGKSAAFAFWGGASAMRTARYRLIMPEPAELYDFLTDPGETVNLAAGRPRTVDSLQSAFTARSPRYPFIPGCTNPAYGQYDSSLAPGASGCGPTGIRPAAWRPWPQGGSRGERRIAAPWPGTYDLTITDARGVVLLRWSGSGPATMPPSRRLSGLLILTAKGSGRMARSTLALL